MYPGILREIIRYEYTLSKDTVRFEIVTLVVHLRIFNVIHITVSLHLHMLILHLLILYSYIYSAST